MNLGRTLFLVALGVGLVGGSTRPAAAAEVKLARADDRVRVEIGGRLFTEYVFKGAYRPYCHPVLAADGTGLTRDFPMKQNTGEDVNHPHHRSLWFAHSDVNGVDFWNQDNVGSPRPKGRIIHDTLAETTSGKDAGVIRATNKWVAPDDRVFCTDERTIRFSASGDDRVMDFEITLRAPAEAPVKLGDNKDGGMAVRVAQWMNLPRPPGPGRGYTGGQGRIVTAKGDRGEAAWGKRGEWCDYHAEHNGKTYGIAIFDHPKNLRHPTWWHARNYGVFSANPLGQKDFEVAARHPPGKGDYTIPAGGSLTLRYRLIFHMGDEKAARLAERYADYAAGK
ncbi:MAG: PmoA family protein [Opitutaceae bacterium]|nr:PmoA family protein [Opitutaceae bacterium]